MTRAIISRLRLSPQPPGKNRRLCNGIFAGFALLFTVLSFNYGMKNGFDRWIPQGIENHNGYVAIAISDLVYGLDRGFMAHKDVFDTLRKNGIAYYRQFLDPLGVKFPDNMSDRALIDNAINRASSLPGLPSDPSVLMKDLQPMPPNDLAVSGFYKLAFMFFGLEVGSFYKAYYLIFVIGAVGFFVGHLRYPVLNMVLAMTCAMHFVLQFLITHGLPPSQSFDLGTIYSGRTISALGWIPGLHALFAVVFPTRFSWRRAALLLFQTLLFLWTVQLRLTLLWMVIAIGVIIAAQIIWLIWERAHRSALNRERLSTLWAISGRTFSWAIVVVIIGYVGFYTHRNASMDPLYRFSDSFIPHHMTWHSIYAGLSTHPDWEARFGKDHRIDGKPAGSDAIPRIAAERYLKERYGIDESYLVSTIWGYKYRTWERITKEVYFDFIKKNPGYFISLHLYWKPIQIIKAYFQGTGLLLGAFSALTYALLLVFGAVCVWILPRTSVGWKSEASVIFALMGYAAMVSVAPMIMTFVRVTVLADQLTMVNMAVSFGIIFTLALARDKYRPG